MININNISIPKIWKRNKYVYKKNNTKINVPGDHNGGTIYSSDEESIVPIREDSLGCHL